MPPSCGLSRMPPSYDSWVNAQVDLMKPVWLTLIPNVFIKSHTHPNDNAHPVPAKHYAYIYMYVCMYVCMCMCMRMRMCMCLYMYMYTLYTFIHT